MNLFDLKKLKINDKPIRLIELFAGIGSQAKAFERLQAKGLLPLGFEHYRICEFDKYAVASYNAVHGTNFAVSDVTKITASDLGIVDADKYNYVLTYSFPCQDLSTAGLQKGLGENTRSGLLWQVERLLKECGNDLPQILLMENVPNLVGKKFKDDFDRWCEFLKSIGYVNKWQVLNAKDFGVPQNRNRVFMVSYLDKESDYEFPSGFPLDKCLADILEDEEVDEKYYLSDDVIRALKLETSIEYEDSN